MSCEFHALSRAEHRHCAPTETTTTHEPSPIPVLEEHHSSVDGDGRAANYCVYLNYFLAKYLQNIMDGIRFPER